LVGLVEDVRQDLPAQGVQGHRERQPGVGVGQPGHRPPVPGARRQRQGHHQDVGDRAVELGPGPGGGEAPGQREPGPGGEAREQSPLDQYQSSGTIDPCNPGIYSTGAAPNDVQQYAPDYLQALQDARNKGCRRGGGAGGVSTTPAAAAPSAGGSGPSASGPASV